MKTKLQLTLVTIASLVCAQTINAQKITYDFENVTAPTTTITGVTIKDGVQEVVSAGSLGFIGNTTNVLHSKVGGANGNTVSDLTNFPTTTADYSVTWKEYHSVSNTTDQLKKGVLLRGTGLSSYQLGIKNGYFFIAQNEGDGTVTFRIAKLDEAVGFNVIPNARIDRVDVGFAVGSVMYYRASAIGSTLTFEYSTDGITFKIGVSIEDSSYLNAGATQVITGVGLSYPNYYFDDITYKAGASLGMESVSLNEKSFSVLKKDNTISINSTAVAIKSVQLFDANGRIIATKNNVNDLITSFSNQTFAKGLILVQITGENNEVITLKLVN